MDIQGNILSQILNSLDFGFIFIVNLVTYLLIKGIEEIITKKPISKLLKRIVTFSTGIIIGFIVLKISEDTKPVIIFYSFFLSLISFDYIFKPIIKRFSNINYKQSDSL
ncbi:hypothetical protein DAC16_127 [Bacteroides phage DAC16]|nr:hypothetical protein DAC16_127 [Bacteroides phage DAC16]